MLFKTQTIFFILLFCNNAFSQINHFTTEFQWHYANFTWESRRQYESALQSGSYIPGNVAMAGIRFYKDKLFISIPQVRPGTPATLAYIDVTSSNSVDPLLTPFPGWELNIGSDCSTLQSVQLMEIDSRGIMWVIDGHRNTNNTKCPAKLVLLDLNCNGKVIHTYTFPDNIVQASGGYLNDIVLDEDEENGYFAYITENSENDPGLVVYSYQQNKAWKYRDSNSKTMSAEAEAANFTIEDMEIPFLVPIDGIALSPRSGRNSNRTLFYCPLTGFNLHAISTDVLKNEQFGSNWKEHIQFIGRKQSQGDGMMMDNHGNLYMTLLPLYGVAKWNIETSFETSKVIDQNLKEMVWTDTMAFDNTGHLYLMTNKFYRFVFPDYPLGTEEIVFRVMKLFTGTKSYLHNKFT